MASVLQLILQAQNNTGPGFAGARSNLVALGGATDRVSLRAQVLSDRIQFQERQLGLLSTQISSTSSRYGLLATQTQTQVLRYDRLADSIRRNRAELDRLSTAAPPVSTNVNRIATSVGAASTAMSALGVAFGAQEVVQFGVNAGRSANTLEKTQATVRAMAGTQERYNEILGLASRNQALYGGTIQNQLSAFRGLIPLANNANVALQSLDQTTRLLSTLSPEQGAEGAAIALRDFLTASGAEGAESLQLRFELDKRGLTDIIRSTDDATERLRMLDEVLAKQGITAATVAAQAGTVANSYDRLGAAASNAQIAIGSKLAQAFQPYAESLTGILQILSGDIGGGIRQMYRGGNMAMGYSREQADERLRTAPYSWMRPDENGTPPIAVQPTPISAPSSQRTVMTSPYANAPTGGITYNIPVTVQGSVVTQQDLVDSVHAGLLQKQNRNGTTGIR